jgi:hypothetical protein
MWTGLMQWTAAEMVECDAIAAALYFMFLVSAHTMEIEMDAN